MFAVQGIYDGGSVLPQEAIPVRESYEVVITFLRPKNIKKSLITEELSDKRAGYQRFIKYGKTLRSDFDYKKDCRTPIKNYLITAQRASLTSL
ncbi:hypothetical protein AGMMS49938_04110 [Fibrobacterales bacterium]|nr:hypothetical protein AGMMS49938_04110 [Fibrobacterales bacterium]